MKKAVEQNRRAIIVLGMHRSGTSALMRAINLCGVELGNRLITPKEDNVTGFWEHKDLYSIHEKILGCLNSSWDDVRPLPENWWKFETITPFKEQIISILKRDFIYTTFWGAKDPRICRLLPLWNSILEETNNHPFYIFILRNPLEVSDSLAKRDGFAKGKSCLLWLKYLLEAEKGTRNTQRMFVTYEELLSNWKGLLSRAENEFDFKWPVSLEVAGLEIEMFLSNTLRHNRVPDSILIENKTLSRWVRDAYLSAKDSTDGENSQLIRTFDTIEAEFKEAASLYEPVLTNFLEKYQTSEAALQDRNLEIENFRETLKKTQQKTGHNLTTIDNLKSEIQEKDERIAHYANEIKYLQNAIGEKENQIGGMKADAEKFRDKWVRSREAMIKSENEIIQLQLGLKERGDHFQKLRNDLAELRKEHFQYQKIVVEREAEIKKLQIRVKEKDDRLYKIDTDLVRSREKLYNSQKAVTKREADIKQLQVAIEDLDEQINQRDAEVKNLGNEVDSMKVQVENYVLRIEHILESSSWKLTAPLRFVSMNVRKLQNNLIAICNIFKRQNGIIKNADEFDPAYYLEQNPDAAASGMDPLEHYLEFGVTEGRTSNAHFNFFSYLEKYLAGFGINGQKYFHQLRVGYACLKQYGFYTAYEKTKNQLKHRKIVSVVASNDYETWIKKWELCDQEFETIRKKISNIKYLPKISIIIPVYNVDQIWLQKAICSVCNQVYDNWELCIVDDGSAKPHIKDTIQKYTEESNKIKAKFLTENIGIAGASNEALSLATGEFVGFLDHDDELSPIALYEIANKLNEDEELDLIYSDEDKIDENNLRKDPFFKPDWSPDTFLSYNYICHFTVVRRKILNEIRGFRTGFDGAQDYDLFLRVVDRTQKISHIPKILYHWRVMKGSTALSLDEKPDAMLAGERAINDYIKRNNISGRAELLSFRYRIKYKIPSPSPTVSLIIPTHDKVDLLRKCVDSILEKTRYPNYEIIIVDNGSKEEATLSYLQNIQQDGRIKIIRDDRPFNYSALHNYTMEKIKTEFVILLNNDTEIISPDWIESMMEFGQRTDVGAVGAMLYYSNDTVQHAGVILGIGGVAGHSHKHMPRGSLGYFSRLKIVQNLSAVTGACLLTKKSIFYEIGGFDENLSHSFNDVDYCLKLIQKGLLVVLTPFAELYHHESLSRGYEDTPEKQARFLKEITHFKSKWLEYLQNGDPYYNPNLTLDKEDFSLKF